jgi:GNAT superfamily N-acetyltransferase
MRVRDIAPSEVVGPRRFLIANGWAHRVGSPEKFADLICNSQCTAVALEGTDVIGFARAITDGLSNGYVSMVAVAAAHRRKGLGTALVSHVTSGPPSITWLLQAARDGSSEFFSKLGFSPAPHAMKRARDQSGT